MAHHHHAGHAHHHREIPVEKRQNQETVVQYVYETAAKTFDGPVGGYSTVNPPAQTPQAASNANTNSNSNTDSNANANANANSNSNANANTNSNSNTNANSNSNSNSNSNNNNNNNNNNQNQNTNNVASQQQAAAPAASSNAASPQSAAAVAGGASQQANQQQQAQTSQAAGAASQQANLATANTQVAGNQATSAAQVQSAKKQDSTTPSTTAAVSSNTATNSSPTSAQLGQASSSPSTSSTASPVASSGGLSPGGKAGLAIGLILLFVVLGALGFFLIRRLRSRREQNDGTYEKTDDEKSAYAAGLARSQSTASTRTAATAPRLSLRPVTQFLPDLAARGKAANAVAAAGLHDSSLSSVAAMARHQNESQTNLNEKSNPFGDHAASAPQPNRVSDTLPIQSNQAENPFNDSAAAALPGHGLPAPSAPAADMPAPLRVRTPTPEGAELAGGAAGLAAVGGAAVAAKAAHNKTSPKPRNMSPNRSISPTPSSSAGSEFSQTPASPGAMANGPPPSNVHRIQLDFKPSMDDELALRAGDLVRLLHEYDDGWALCIRLDRSQQGVAPRTCLSARPVKPRPRGPPRGPGPRGPPPPGMRNPGQQRPQSPAGGRGSPGPNARGPRPMGPMGPMGPMSPMSRGGSPRSMSPGPYGGGSPRMQMGPPQGGKRRSNSASDFRRPGPSSNGPSAMNPDRSRAGTMTSTSGRTTPNRKPVPGQAM